jgi:DNA-binding GntR family transcriptional regulator
VVITKATYRDQVVTYIYEAILKGHLHSGERITESDLAEKLRISRAPIREALGKLALEGLVEYRPQIGNFVAALSSKQIYDTYITRGVLEGFAVRDALDSFAEEDLEKLEGFIGGMVRSARQGQAMRLADYDNQFHEYLFSKGQNFQLMELSRRLSLVLHLLFCKHWTKVYAPEQIQARHQRIVDQIRSRDPEAIELCIRNHYAQTGTKMTQFGSDK